MVENKHIHGGSFRVFNKSSERMDEIADEIIDLVVTGPPYNIGTVYGDFGDNLAFDRYVKLLANVIGECYRVQTPKGRLIVEIADSVRMGNRYVQLAGLFQSICLKTGYSLIRRDINFLKSENHVELTDHSFDDNYSTFLNGHSNCHQIMAFSKDRNAVFSGGNVCYLNYEDSPYHPCPFPLKTIKMILDRHFRPGMSVLDTFMGTAGLGREVLARGGSYFGYEINRGFYLQALKNLGGVKDGR